MPRRLHAALLAAAALLALPASGQAAGITVTTTDDLAVPVGQCSLRQAITSANNDLAPALSSCTAGSGADVITVPASAQPYKLTGSAGDNANALGDLDVTANVTINGAGRTATVIDGNGVDRIFEIHPGVTAVTMHALTLTGGRGPDGPPGEDGEDATITPFNVDVNGSSGNAGFDGGAIFHGFGTLTLDDVVLRGNAAGDGGKGGKGGVGEPGNGDAFGGGGGAGGAGGAILAQAPLVVENSVIEDNAAGRSGDGGDGGISGPGSGADGGTAGSGGAGGAIATRTAAADVTITDSILRDNRAGRAGNGGKGGLGGPGGGPGGNSPGGHSREGGDGGAISSTGDLEISGSVVANNAAGDSGVGGDGGQGGQGNGGSSGGSSEAGHGDEGGRGGGIRAQNGLITISASEITDNSTGDGGDGGSGGLGGPDATTSASSAGGDGAAGGRGGAIYLDGTAHGSIENTTIALNTTGAGGDGGSGGAGPKNSDGGGAGQGGAFGGVVNAASQTTTLDFVTVAGNTTGAQGRPGREGTGTIPEAGPPGAEVTAGDGVVSSNNILLRRSIVTSNVGGKPFCIGTSCSGGSQQCNGGFAAGSGDTIAYPAPATCPSLAINPLLGGLALHGGFSRTLIPGAGSPAIDAFTGACSGTDQRGVTRPKNGKCDFGAVERSLPGAATGAASGITRTGASLAGTANPGELATTYRFEVGTTTEYGFSTAAKAAGAGNASVGASADVADLTPGTTYHYRLRATNVDGTTVGEDKTFTTAPPTFAGVAIVSRSVRLDSKGRAAITLSCPAGLNRVCGGTLSLTRVVTVKKTVKRKVKGVVKRVRVRVKVVRTIGTSTFARTAGTSTPVLVKIARSARSKTVAATAKTVAKDAFGTVTTQTAKVTLKPAKKKKKKR